MRASISTCLWLIVTITITMCRGPMASVRASDMAVFPHPSTWPTRPVYLVAEDGVDIDALEDGAPLPLGRRVRFETPAFSGTFFLRLRDNNPHPVGSFEHNAHVAYFAGRKRLYQLVVQGRFKERGLAFSDVVLGDVYDRPMKGVPSGRLFRAIKKVVESITPGMVFDIGDRRRPKVLAPIGGAQTMRVDLPGQEPAEYSNIVESTGLLGAFDSAEERRKRLGNPTTARQYRIDPGHVYTFEVYDSTMDFGNYYQHIMMGLTKIDLVRSLDGQSLSLGMYKREGLSCLFNFSLLHERSLTEG